MRQITESVPQEDPEIARTRIGFRRLVLQLAFAASLGAVMWGLVWSTVGSRYHWLHSLFVPSSIVLAFGLFILREERHWKRQARRLTHLLEEIRAGTAPIEELETIEGGLLPLVSALQAVFRELRQQKIEVAQLNQETRQRVAGRTNALERQIGSLRTQATRDQLTTLFNRRMFDAFLPKMIERCTAEKIDLSVLMIDVDNFKLLNDALGHAAGDEFLRDIAQILRSGVRDQDAAFRLGGDEFVVILPGQDPGTAADVSKRLIQLVDALAKPLEVKAQPRLSIGVASLSQLAGKNVVELVHLADKRLYEMKATRFRPARKQTLRASA